LKRLWIAVALVVIGILASAGALGWWLTSRSEGQYFENEGTRLFLSDEGTGEAVVLLHGFAVNGDLNWRIPGITEALAQNFRVITLDAMKPGVDAMVGVVPYHTVVYIEGADHMAAVGSPILLESLQE